MALSTGPSGAAGSWHRPASLTIPPSTPIFISGSANSSELCHRLGLEPFTPLYEIQRQRLIDGRPVLHVSHHLLASCFPDIASAPLASSLTELYQQRYGIGQGGATLEITPSAARGTIARALNLAEGSAVLRLVRVNYDQAGTLVDCDIEHWRPDAIRIRLDTRMLQPAAGR